MLLKFVLEKLSVQRQVSFMQKRGIVLATRWKDGRHVYIYMFRNLFAEIIYINDNPQEHAESLVLIQGLDKLNHHLGKDIKSII